MNRWRVYCEPHPVAGRNEYFRTKLGAFLFGLRALWAGDRVRLIRLYRPHPREG